MFRKSLLILFAIHLAAAQKTWLRADGRSDTYELIESVLGRGAPEVPDCGHQDFGQHITQTRDSSLRRNIFVFHIHVEEDSDRCSSYTKQRNEIKVTPGSTLNALEGETMTLSWNFRLNQGFRTSNRHTAIHQVKAKDGNDQAPMIDINLKTINGRQILILEHQGDTGGVTQLATDNLARYVGAWVHVKEELTFGDNGQYSIEMTGLLTRQRLLSFSSDDLDLWRDGASKARPKWGIYRGLGQKSALRDEQVYFDSFCISKDPDDPCT